MSLQQKSILELDVIDIDLKEDYSLGTDIECHQNDNLILKFCLRDYGELVDLTNWNVELRVKRADGNDYIQTNTGIVKDSNGNLTINTTDQMTCIGGSAKGELRLWNSSYNQKTGRTIYIKVIPSTLSVENQISESTITILNHLDYTLNSSIDKINVMNETINRGNSMNSTLNNTINNANSKNNTLNSTIGTANSTNNTLNETIRNANSTNTTLNNTNRTATETNTTLNNTNRTATETNTTLNNTINNANSKNNALNETIRNAVSKNETLNSTINNANTANTNLTSKTTTANSTLSSLNSSNTTASATLKNLNDANTLAQSNINEIKKLDVSNIGTRLNELTNKVNAITAIPTSTVSSLF